MAELSAKQLKTGPKKYFLGGKMVAVKKPKKGQKGGRKILYFRKIYE
jgi:hypothetical protein